MLKFLKLTISSSVFFSFFLCFPVFVSASDYKSYYYDSMDVEIVVNEDSTFDVSEKMTVVFDGEFEYGFRAVEMNMFSFMSELRVYDGAGKEIPPKKIYTDYSYTPHRRTIEWPMQKREYNNETLTFTVKYKIYGGVGTFEDHDEIYWNAIFPDRTVNVNEATVKVVLPGTVDEDSINTKTLEVARTVDVWGNEVNFKSTSFISPYEDFTVVVGWPKGHIEYPGAILLKTDPEKCNLVFDNEDLGEIDTSPDGLDVWGLPIGEHTLTMSGSLYHSKSIKVNVEESDYVQTSPNEYILEAEPIGTIQHRFLTTVEGVADINEMIEVDSGEQREVNVQLERTTIGRVIDILLILGNICGCLLVPGFIGAVFYLWSKKGKDIGGRKTIVPWFKPPDGVSPAIVGTIVDEKVHMVDITSVVIDLAYRGYLKIVDKGKEGLFGNKRKYEFVKLKEFDDLKKFEREIVEGMFSSKDKVTTAQLKNKFYTKIPGIRDAIHDEMLDLEYFDERPDKSRGKWLGIGIVSGVFAIMLGVGVIFIGIYTLIFASIVFAAAMIFVSFFMPKKTPKGVDALEKAKGFKMYLETAERFRLQNLTPETFEKFLSYAIVFGVEKQWAEKFKDIYKQPPDWYEGDWRTFNTVMLANSLSSMNSDVGTVLASAPSSARGSGASFGGGWSGGGGFSGGSSGGGGGGGGGGFA